MRNTENEKGAGHATRQTRIRRMATRSITMALALLTAASASAHPWHRHREPDTAPTSVHTTDTTDGSPFILTAAPRPARGAAPDIAAAFAPFVKLEAIATRSDDRWF